MLLIVLVCSTSLQYLRPIIARNLGQTSRREGRVYYHNVESELAKRLPSSKA